MTLLATSDKPLSNAVKWELPKNLSRKTVTLNVAGDTVVKINTVLGKVFAGTGAAVAGGSNTGDGVMGAITVTGTAKQGDYVLTVIEPAANAGSFIVEDPDGVNVGSGDVASAFTGGGISFTLADGATDFASGDTFAITVTKTSEKYKPAVETATDGSKVFAGLLVALQDNDEEFTFLAATDYSVVILEKDAMVAAEGLVLDSTYDSQAKLDVIHAKMESVDIRVGENRPIGPLL